MTFEKSELIKTLELEIEQLKSINHKLYRKNKNLQRSNLRLKNIIQTQKNIIDKSIETVVDKVTLNNDLNIDEGWENI